MQTIFNYVQQLGSHEIVAQFVVVAQWCCHTGSTLTVSPTRSSAVSWSGRRLYFNIYHMTVLLILVGEAKRTWTANVPDAGAFVFALNRLTSVI